MKKLDNKTVFESFYAAFCSPLAAQFGLLASLTILSAPLVAQVIDEPVRRCANEVVEQRLQRRFPERKQQFDELNEQVRAFGSLSRQARGANETVYRIPVVVHVVHNNASGVVGGVNNPNISDEQIRSQLRVLNEDYRKVANTPGGTSTSPLAVDTGIEFYLATTDPQGNPSNGITRTFTTTARFAITADQFRLAEIVYWPTNQYLNIWVCANSETEFLGYGQFPTVNDSSVPGLEPVTDERIDGVVVDNRFFGAQTGTVTSRLYCCGRTMTHEIGHWLGLFHPNGDTNCGDDFVADTPPTESLNNTNSIACNPVFSTCNGIRTRNQIENYMDYTPDVCMNLFTAGQRDRMRAVLELSPRRRQVVASATILEPTAQLTLTVSPNPVSSLDESVVAVQFTGSQAFETALLDATGRLIQAQTYPTSLSRRVSLSARGLPAGMYFFRVTTQAETATTRVLVR